LKKKYTKAEQFNKQALANIEKALGPNHPETGESLYKMAEMYYLKKNYNKAIELLNRSLLIKENFYGNENINLLPTLELMFNLTKTQGDKKKLKVLKSRIKRIRSKDQS
jgi:tetratricopeptide (TPR) repeat protein